MADREILLKLLDEYNAVLETLRQEEKEIQASENTPDGLSRRAITNQLSYLEYRILQLETQLSILDLNVRHLAPKSPVSEAKSSLLAQLNPWHADFRIWTYVAVLAVMIFTVIACNMVLAY